MDTILFSCLIWFAVLHPQVLSLKCYSCTNVWAREKLLAPNGTVTWGKARESNSACGKTRLYKVTECGNSTGLLHNNCAVSLLIQYHEGHPVLKKTQRSCLTKAIREKWMHNFPSREGCTPFRSLRIHEGLDKNDGNPNTGIKEKYCFCANDLCNSAVKDHL